MTKLDAMVSDLANHALAGVEGSLAAASAAAVLSPVEAPVYPEEASSAKERRHADRELLRTLVRRGLEGRTSDGSAAEAVTILLRLLAAEEDGKLAEVPPVAEKAGIACLYMAFTLLCDAPEPVMRHQKQVTLRAIESL